MQQLRSPLAPLTPSERLRQQKGGTGLEVPLLMGDLGGSQLLQQIIDLVLARFSGVALLARR